MTAVVPSPPAGFDDPFDVRRAVVADRWLRIFNDAGVLVAADVHVALRLGHLGRTDDDSVLLAAALAVRAPRLGHVCADLALVHRTVTVDGDTPVDVDALPWPEPGGWLETLAASPLVTVGDLDDDAVRPRPLRLIGTLLYLDRYWREERQVASDLLARAGAAPEVDLDRLEVGLGRLFDGPPPDLARQAAAAAVTRRLTVVAGGPGTGKSTTVARILALLDEQAGANGRPPPLVALAAPTGKAAARLEEAVHEEAGRIDVGLDVRERLLAARASTLHRLLGWRPGGRSRFRHHRDNRLPHDMVIVDETSMVPLSLMARLLEAVRPAARLVLVGDPEQLASVEAGAVLGDIVGPSTGGPGGEIGKGIVVLRQVHRFGGGIAELADAIRTGEADRAMSVLAAGDRPDVEWIPVDVAAVDPSSGSVLAPVETTAVATGQAVFDAAAAGDGLGALGALGRFRLLCPHRRGPYGVARWTDVAESWLAAALPGYRSGGPWYLGRPLLVTENDYGLRLYNGDTGVVIASPTGGITAAFERAGRLLTVGPSRLASIETVHAMTVHKSQGSQFDEVAVVLPDPSSAVLTRELLYTAATRARSRLVVVGTEAAVAAAVARPVARASGLGGRLRPTSPPED